MANSMLLWLIGMESHKWWVRLHRWSWGSRKNIWERMFKLSEVWDQEARQFQDEVKGKVLQSESPVSFIRNTGYRTGLWIPSLLLYLFNHKHTPFQIILRDHFQRSSISLVSIFPHYFYDCILQLTLYFDTLFSYTYILDPCRWVYVRKPSPRASWNWLEQ